ncbi:MAG TPA: hypothetical protein VN605_09520, partial [Thermoanaerobaculia bacterium]|nr:hypothetical protein [Thermoanaerobaculia bacterium]
LTATSLTLDNGTAVILAELNEDTLYDAGDVKVGDNVDLRTEKIGNRFVAKMVTRLDFPATFTFIGIVKSIAGDTWTVESSTTNTPTDGPFVRTRIMKVTAETQVAGNPQVNDRVIVLSKRAPNGDLTAVSIARDPHQ